MRAVGPGSWARRPARAILTPIVMDHRKLFNVLVLGGAMLGLGCLEEDPPPPEDAGAAMSDDAGADVDASAGGDAGGLMEESILPGLTVDLR